MSSKEEAAAFDSAAAARLAGTMMAALAEAKNRISRSPGAGSPEWGKEHAGYRLYHALVEARQLVSDVIDASGWTAEQTAVPSAWHVRRVRVADLKTDDVVNIKGRWTEVRDVWGYDDEDPAEHLGEGHDDVQKIRDIMESSLPYMRLALRVVDIDYSNPHEIVCGVVGFDAHDLVSMQFPGQFAVAHDE